MSTVREFIDAAASVPFEIWIGIVGVGVLMAVAVVAATAPLITPEQREEIARAHRELRGTRGMPSTRSTARPPSRGGTSPRHPPSGRAASAPGRGRPRRDRLP